MRRRHVILGWARRRELIVVHLASEIVKHVCEAREKADNYV